MATETLGFPFTFQVAGTRVKVTKIEKERSGIRTWRVGFTGGKREEKTDRRTSLEQ